MITLLFCNLCGDEIESNLEGCHVKDRAAFSDEDKASGFDRFKNIIWLCKKHHDLFDNRRAENLGKALGIADWGPDSPLTFIRWNHCWEGFCSHEPDPPLRLLEYIEWGGDGDRIDPEYIRFKNDSLPCARVKAFTSRIPPSMEFKQCIDPTID